MGRKDQGFLIDDRRVERNPFDADYPRAKPGPPKAPPKPAPKPKKK